MQETRGRRPELGFEREEEWSEHLMGTTVRTLGSPARMQTGEREGRDSIPMN